MPRRFLQRLYDIRGGGENAFRHCCEEVKVGLTYDAIAIVLGGQKDRVKRRERF